MKRTCRLLIILLVMLFAGENVTVAQTTVFDKWKARKTERKMSGEKRKVPKEKKIKEPRSVIKAKKKQEKRQEESLLGDKK